MKLAIHITHDDGTTRTVYTNPADLVAWERDTGKSITDWGTTPPTYSDVAFLAWRAATRGANPRPEFDPWLDGVGDLTLADVTDGDPTPPGP